jgi:hypothetical protein
MKILEGKTPAERNKLIAAIVLGGVAVIALSYTLSGFFFPTRAKNNPAVTATPSPTANSQNSDVAVNQNTQTSLADLAWMLVTPVSYAQNSFSGDAGRNVFAFYEPPPPTPWQPTPVPVPSYVPPPTPVPPTVILGYISPSSVYSGSKGFRLEVAGDKFTPETKILFNGSELPTNFVNGQKLTADISVAMITGEGTRQIMVRSPDGKLWSNPTMMQVQAPPQPNFEYIGLIEKKHRNNDMAMLKEKGKTEVGSFRLNDPVGDRFRLVSISPREVILEDRSLGFKHRLMFLEGKGTGSGAGGSTIINTGGFGRGGQGTGLPNMYVPMNPVPGGPNPTMIAPGDIPGIPANVQRYTPPTVANPNTNTRPPQKKDYEDDDDGPNR